LVSKLHKALELVNTEIAHLQVKIKTFKNCQRSLQNEILGDHHLPLEYRVMYQRKAFKQFTGCAVNIECKLSRWLKLLEGRKYDMQSDLDDLNKGWIPYAKKSNFFVNFH